MARRRKVGLVIFHPERPRFVEGARVCVGEGSGIDSGRCGVVASYRAVKTDGRGIPTNIPGAYSEVDRKREVPVRLDDGRLILMFKNRLHAPARKGG